MCNKQQIMKNLISIQQSTNFDKRIDSEQGMPALLFNPMLDITNNMENTHIIIKNN